MVIDGLRNSTALDKLSYGYRCLAVVSFRCVRMLSTLSFTCSGVLRGWNSAAAFLGLFRTQELNRTNRENT
jgi:hypothetical protein